MNFDQSSDTEEEPTENTRLMSETVAMENQAYKADQADSHSTASRHSDSRRGDNRPGDHSRPAEIVPAANETVSLITLFCCLFIFY